MLDMTDKDYEAICKAGPAIAKIPDSPDTRHARVQITDEDKQLISEIAQKQRTGILAGKDVLEALQSRATPRYTNADEELIADNEQKLAKIANIEATLNERGSKYGVFKNRASLTQELKHVFYSHVAQFNPDANLTNSQCEAIDMIFDKIGRIGNGDPNYADSWIDIAGYATLIVKELNGEEI